MRRVLSVILAVLLCFSLTACAAGSSERNLDINALAEELSKLDCFGGDIFQLGESVIPNFIQVADGVKAVVYTSSGATADEIALFEAPDEKTAGEQLKIAENHIAERTAAYASYMPDEVTKLEDAIVRQEGCYVILCVAGDYEAAQTVIDKFI